MESPAFGVIFDVDGVLVDSAEAHYAAWCLLAAQVGKPLARDFFDRTFGTQNRDIIPVWLGPAIAPEEVERLSLLKEALYRDVARATLEPLPGAADLVRALAAAGDFALAVGSSAPPENVDLALEVLGIGGLFAAIVTGRDTARGKPDPEVFVKAIAKLGLPPSRCAVIEDAPQGVEAGLRAGARVIAVTSTRARRELAAANLVVASLNELEPGRIRGLLERGQKR